MTIEDSDLTNADVQGSRQKQQRYALISVSDKTGIELFARGIVTLGYKILSTSNTAKALEADHTPVIQVSDHTGFPEMLGGRVKTLHPKIHGGILARRDVPAHMSAIAEVGIEPIDLVVVNLYPFEQTVAKPDCTLEQAIENIDIGGPAMVRSAAKNYASVIVTVNPADYSDILVRLRADTVDMEFRHALAQKAFTHTAAYDAAIAKYLDNTGDVHGLRYGHALCGFSSEPPKGWPEGQKWVRFDEVDKITCRNCRVIAEHFQRYRD